MAQATYRLRTYNTSGVQQQEITDFSWLSFTKRVNSPGVLSFGLAGDKSYLSSLADKWIVQIDRKPVDGTWTTELSTFFRDAIWTFPETGSQIVLQCVGVMDCLSWREIGYYAGVSNRTFFSAVAAETVLKTLVDYNAGPNATTGNSRFRTGTLGYPTLSLQADGAGGNTITLYCAYKNLLRTLQDVASVAGGDFSLTELSPVSYRFDWHTGQLGADRTADLQFSMERGNMREPEYRTNRAPEKTVAIVAGKGEASDRDIVVRTGSNYNVTTNNIEKVVASTGTDKGDTTGLNAKGDEALERLRAQETFNFKIQTVESARYGVDFFLGDLVGAKNPFTGTVGDYKIEAVTVTLTPDGTETVSPEVREV